MAKAEKAATVEKAKAKPELSLAEQIRAAVVARKAAIADGKPKPRKAAKAAVEKFRTTANLAL